MNMDFVFTITELYRGCASLVSLLDDMAVCATSLLCMYIISIQVVHALLFSQHFDVGSNI